MHLLVDLLALDPYEFDALMLLAEILIEDGRKAEARHALERVLRFEPDHLAALYHIGGIRLMAKEYDDAMDAWQRILVLDPASEYAQRARSQLRSSLLRLLSWQRHVPAQMTLVTMLQRPLKQQQKQRNPKKCRDHAHG